MTRPSSHAALVRARKSSDAAACGIDDAFIAELVEGFYDTVRRDGRFGLIFARHVKDWPLHLARMKDFWASIMIESGRFNGSPMQKHIAIGGLEAEDFAHWQLLWDQTLTRLAPDPVVRDRFREAARRIGESLLMGIEIDRDGLAAISAQKPT